MPPHFHPPASTASILTAFGREAECEKVFLQTTSHLGDYNREEEKKHMQVYQPKPDLWKVRMYSKYQ